MSETILLGYGASPPVSGGSSVTLGSSGATVFMSGVSVAASGLTLQGGALTVCGTAGGIGQAFGAAGWAPAPAASPAPAAMAVPYSGFYVLTSSALALAPGAPGASVLVKNYTAAPATLTGSLVPPYLSISAETLTLQAGGAARLVSDGGAWYAQAVTGAPPGVSAISPTTGPTGGETNVEITGSGLTGATQVRFGTLVSPSYTVSGDTLVTASAPFAGTSESLTVYVQTPVGVNATGPSYLYRNGSLPPTVTGIIPVSGPVTGSSNGTRASTATVTGSGFIAASGGVGNSIMIGGNAATLYSRASSTETAISLGSIPAGVVGPASVAVTTSGGTSTVNDLYVYNPVLRTLTPSNGPLAGGGTYAVTLSGYGFASATSVYFGATPATGLTVNTDNSVTVFAPDRGAGPVNVVLAVSGYVSNPAVYNYVLAPVIQAVTPDMGPVVGATPITLSGQNFNTVYSVTFNGDTAIFTVNSDNLITTTPPSFPTVVGVPIQVSVVSPGGHGDSTYTYLNVPDVQLVTPSVGPTAGNQLVNITGQYLSYASEVTIGGVAVSGPFTVVNDGLISATTPAGSAGLTSVVVTTPGGNGTNNGYTYVAPPTLSEISPAMGPLAGGQSVTVSGTGLADATSLTIVDVAAIIVSKTDNTIVATTEGSAAGRGNVVVTSAGGSATLVDAYTYVAAPSIQAITPNKGPLISTSRITISGVNFTNVNVVTFESISADFTVVSDNVITALPPTGPVGLATLYIASLGGSSASGYTYLNAPNVQLVNPSAGPTAGNQPVTITGQYLSYASEVTIGGVAVSGPFTVVNDGLISATTPAGSAGLTGVAVTTPGGNSTNNNYTYVAPPTLSEISPAAGPLAGGQSVTICGTNLSTVTSLTIVDVAADYVPITDNIIVATTRSSAAGRGNVVVSNAGGSATLVDAYTYVAAPSIQAITPNMGPLISTSQITISGVNFTDVNVVTFESISADFTVVSDNVITALPPTGPVGLATLYIASLGGSSASGYTYLNVPNVQLVTPSEGPTTGNQPVNITGQYLSYASEVTIGGVAVSGPFTVVNDGLISATTPAGSAGLTGVTVTTPGGIGTNNGYTYVAPPTLSEISPAAGPLAGGQSVTVTGTGLAGATALTISGRAAIINSSSDLSIQATSPSGDIGVANVEVITVGGSAALSAAYTYVALPTLTRVSPAAGPLTSALPVSLTGSALSNALQVTFGSLSGVVQANTDTNISVVPPTGTVGTVPITVTTAGGDASGITYTYNPQPVIVSVTPTAGPLAGDAPLTVTGSGFTGTLMVSVGSRAVMPQSVLNNEITLLTPSGAAAGPADVVVVAIGGQASAANAYTYVVPPLISGVAPTAGPVAGGQTVTLTGAGFTGASLLTLAGAAATISSVTDTSIVAVTTASGAGAGAISLITAGGVTTSGTYYYLNSPNILEISPPEGTTAGNQTIDIIGQYLSFASEVTFSGVAASGPFTIVNDSLITATTPAGSAGPTYVTVITPGGSGNRIYTYVAPPTLSEISPAMGPLAGGQSVTICGTNLSTVTSLTIVDVAATIVSKTDNTIVATTEGSAAGRGNVVVSNVGGSATLVDAYTYVAAPSIQAITPNMGPLISTSQITISGVNFTDVNVVTFESISADFTVVNDNTITTLPPTGPVGLATLYIASPGGNDSSGYTYLNAPGVPTVTPSAGPTGGNQSVSITGPYLSYATAVMFGGVPVSGPFTSTNDIITATTPPGMAGLTAVSITTPGGSVTASAYTYVVPPLISAVAPTAGPVAGGQTVTLTGAGFTGASLLTLAGAAATISSVTDTSIVAVTTASGAGAGLVSLTTAGGVTTSGTYNYLNAPNVQLVSPSAGPIAGNQTVTISGQYLLYASEVTFGGVSASGPFIINGDGTAITATSPAGANGTTSITVTTPGGTGTGVYRYAAPPTLSEITPASGPLAGPPSVAFSGIGLTGASLVTFGGTTVVPTISSDSLIWATPPAASSPTSVSTTITTPGGVTSALTYNYLPAPTLLSIAPTTGPLTGSPVMLSGAALATATAVSFGGAAAAFSVSSDSTVWATAPAGTGTVGVGVTTLGGTSATVSYRYVPLPSVTGVTPAAGPLAGVASVTLTGTYFTEASQVSFGTVSGAFTVSSDSCIVATAPAASAGAVTVYVTTPYGVNASSPPFTYLAPPVITQLYPGNSGPVTGQDYLQLFGSNFTSDSVVTLAGVVVPNQFLGTTSVAINNYPPGDVGTVPVTLTTPGGSSTQNFTYVPIVTGIAPAAGPLAGGGAVVVTGSGFTAASTVTLGTATVSALSASGGTSLTALAPAGTGTVLVNVTTSGFVSDNTTVTYEYVPPPVIETVSASFGPITGGQTVSLYGTGLSYVTAASFGGVARTPTVVSDSLLTLAAPTTSSFGPTPITVSSVGGTASGTYTYAPTVAAVAPAYGPSAGGQLVTVAGTGFTASSTLRIGGAAATGLVCTVSNSLQAVTPAGAKGAAAVTVTTSGVASQDPVTYQYYVAPTITAITPASGPILGGQLVTVSGTEFAPGLTTVTLGGKNATPSGVTETGLTFTTPSGASIGAATLAVTTPGGTASGTYTYVPSVAVVTPGYGPLSGGTAITISGGGFGAGSTVTIGGRAATSVSYVNPSQISAVTPSGAVGPASVLVTTSGLTSASNSLFAFEPEVTSVLPIGGTDDGGTLVTLTGTGFTGATAVAFGDVAATLVTVTSDTQLTAVSPSALTDDTVPVSVTVSGIISTVAAPYTYAPSVMTDLVFLELTPTPSYLGNGYWISGTDYFITLYSLYITWENANEVLNSFVTGSGVVGTATVLNNVQWYIPANTLLTMVWEPMLIYYRTPRPGYPNYAELSLYSVVRVDGNVYPYALTVGANLFNDGTMTSTRHLPAVQPYILGGDAPPPTVAAVTPPTGKATGGDTITVSGTGFLESSTVTVGGAAATDVVFISEDALTATTPAGALGAASVVVTTTGQSSAPNALYTYHPAVTAVTPGTGSVDGGTIITITGAGFSAASTVTVAGAPATGVAYDTGVLTAQTPASAFGPASVVVTTSGLSSAANTLYTYVPTVTGVTPASGPAGGGELISVSGSGFNAGTVLTVGGAPATGVVYISESALTGITPAGGVGAASVVVTTGAYSSEANSLYAYNPSVAGVTPASGTVTGGTLITISGSGFSAGSTVTVGGASASGVAYSAGALTARTPAGAAGAASVLVTTSGRVSAPNSFYQYVITPPTLQSVTPSVGAQSGGQLVTLSGTHFTGASAITFDGSPGVIVSVPSDSQLTATTPAGATAGAVSVLLTTPNGPNPANTLYTYDPALNPPTGLNGTTAGVSYGPPYGVWTIYENIVSWDANGGSVSGYHLVIDAAGYASPSVLFSGDVGNVTSYTQKLIASAGPPLGYATLTLYSINSQGVSGSLATVGNVPVQLIYTSGPAPVITGLHPPTGPLTGGQALTVCGQNLAGATTALFANSQVAAVYNADGTVSVTTPAAAAGAVPVVVNAEGGPSAVNSTYYTYYAPPTVSSISPIAGPATAGTLVTLTGTNFTGLTGVTFGGRPGASPTFLDDSSITVLAPSGPLGSAAVVVSTYSGSGATTYIYDGPPTFTGITPAKGVSIGGTPVTISGDYLAATTSVTFNGAAGTITGVTDTALTVITPAGSGPAVVGIQSTAGAAYSASGAYTYYGPDYNPPTNVTLTRLFGPYGNQVSWTPAEGSSPSAIDYYDVTITSTFGMAIFSASGPGYITSIPQYIPSVSGSTQAVARVTAVLTNGDSGATGNSPVSQAFYYTP